MDSSLRFYRPTVPTSLVILPSDRFIGQTLDALCGIDPCAEGGIEAVNIDQQAILYGAEVHNFLGTGYEEIHAVDDGFCIHFLEGIMTHDWSLTARNLKNCLRLRIAFTGTADFESTDASVSDEGSRCTFIVQPAGTSMTGVYRAGTDYRYCTLHISQHFLESRLGLAPAELPRVLSSAWSTHETALGHITLSRSALSTAARFFSLSTRGNLRRIEVHAIALDLLHHLLGSWADARVNSSTRVRLRPSERNQLAKLRDLAAQKCPEPISIAEAVEFTGLNKNKIHVGFHQFFGMSLREYCFELRMQQAKALLLESDMSISEVAATVGFSEPTNFTNAFQKHCGTLPSYFRRAGKATVVSEARALDAPVEPASKY